MRLALTYDDGPSRWTAEILDLLAARDAHATFFVLGQHIQGNEATLRRTLKEGHQIGNHTWTHRKLTDLTDDQSVRFELEDTTDAIEQATGHTVSLWRAPHFAHDSRVNMIARGLGLTHVGCDIDPGDWLEEDPAKIAGTVERNMRPGAIVDLHDGMPPNGGNGSKSRAATVRATQLLLDMPDIEFVTVAEL